MRAIPFFTDDIAIEPHTATRAGDIGRRITVREFAAGHPVSLHQDGHDLHLYAGKPGTTDYRFIIGPEV